MKLTKKEIYAKHGIIYDTKTQKIEAPIFGFIPPVLVNGNEKIGKGAYHYSMLPTNREYKLVIDGKEYTVKGTCLCTCMNENGDITCYATKGNYNFKSVLRSLAKIGRAHV